MGRQKDEPSDSLEWELYRTVHPGDLLRTIALMPPPHSIVFLEGLSIAPAVAEVYQRLQVKAKRQIPSDYVDARPATYHLPATPGALNELAALFDMREDHEEVADHLKLYGSHGVLFAWHDVGRGGWPMLLSDRMDKELVRIIRKTHKLALTRLPK